MKNLTRQHCPNQFFKSDKDDNDLMRKDDILINFFHALFNSIAKIRSLLHFDFILIIFIAQIFC